MSLTLWYFMSILLSLSTDNKSSFSLDLHCHTRKYNASESLFDHTSAVVDGHCSHKMTGTASSTSLIIQLDNSSLQTEVLSDDGLETDNESDVSSKLNQNSSSDEISYNHQSDLHSSPSVFVSNTEVWFTSQNHSNDINSSDDDDFKIYPLSPGAQQSKRCSSNINLLWKEKTIEQHTATKLYTPTRKLIHDQHFQTPDVSLDRQKELINEIHNSGKSLQVEFYVLFIIYRKE